MDRYKKYSDRHRKNPPVFSVGSMVWLNNRNLSSRRPCPKLDLRRLGPFSIAEKLDDVTFRLDLPDVLPIYSTFHVSLWSPFIPILSLIAQLPLPNLFICKIATFIRWRRFLTLRFIGVVFIIWLSGRTCLFLMLPGYP